MTLKLNYPRLLQKEMIPFIDGGLFSTATVHVFPIDLERLILSYLDPELSWYLGGTCGANPRNLVEYAEYYAKHGWIEPFILMVAPRFDNPDAVLRIPFLQSAIKLAAYHGQEAIFHLCLEWGTPAWYAIYGAASHPTPETSMRMILLCREEHNYEFPRTVAFYAAASGHEDIVRLCLEWGADNFGGIAAQAASYGHKSIVHLCREWKRREEL